MRFCRFNDGAHGVVRNGHVYDVEAIAAEVVASSAPARVPGDEFITHLSRIAERVVNTDLGSPACALAEARLLAPVRVPTKVIGAPSNYHSHIDEAETSAELTYGRPYKDIESLGLFLKSSSSLVGPSEGIVLRFPDRRTDHEVEVAVVIGQPCSRVAPSDALDRLAGYSLALDVTLRGPEDRSFRKSIDTYSVLGPYLLTPDEVPDPASIPFSLAVNGELRQKATTAQLVKDIPALVAWASEWYTLYPGDVIMTGTPAGVGPLQPGDVIECTMGAGDSVVMKVEVLADADGRVQR